jgi:prophage antirepressor-like protein
MNQFQLVKYDCQALNCSIDCIIVDGEPWFDAQSVAEILGYDNPSEAIRDHVRRKYKTSFKNLTLWKKLFPSEIQRLIITDAGVWELIFKSSKLQEAQVFCNWLCTEVLPSIREKGTYDYDDIMEWLQLRHQLI